MSVGEYLNLPEARFAKYLFESILDIKVANFLVAIWHHELMGRKWDNVIYES